MFPISDIIPSRTRPVVTIGLIAVNTLLFLYQLQLDDVSLQRLVFQFGVIPARFSFTDAVTSMFLHADFLHFLGNMVFLWIFGDNVEDRLGHVQYTLFYFGCGMLAAAAQTFADPASFAPMIGASGAIAGVMGAYFVIYPHSRVLTAVFLLVFLDVIEIPAIFFLGIWFLLQLLHGAMSYGTQEGGIAFWAHAAGFVAGIAAGIYVRLRSHSSDDYWRAVGQR
jgi:membrane associated rhomboid family serine protease